MRKLFITLALASLISTTTFAQSYNDYLRMLGREMISPVDRSSFYLSGSKRISTPLGDFECVTRISSGSLPGSAWLGVYDISGRYNRAYYTDVVNFKALKKHMKFKLKSYFPHDAVNARDRYVKCVTADIDYYPYDRGKTKVKYKAQRLGWGTMNMIDNSRYGVLSPDYRSAKGEKHNDKSYKRLRKAHKKIEKLHGK